MKLQIIEIAPRTALRISMSRTANPYDNARLESFLKTLKYEEVHLPNYETYQDVIGHIPHFIDEVYNRKRNWRFRSPV